ERGLPDKHSQAVLEAPHSAEQCRLETRASACCFRDLQQQLAVCRGIAEFGDHAIVAVHLDGKAETPHLPPHREVPWHEQNRQGKEEHQVRIVRLPMFLFVADDVLTLCSWKAEDPSWN